MSEVIGVFNINEVDKIKGNLIIFCFKILEYRNCSIKEIGFIRYIQEKPDSILIILTILLLLFKGLFRGEI